MTRLWLLIGLVLLAGCVSPKPAVDPAETTSPDPTDDPGPGDHFIMIPANGSQPLPFLVQKGCTSLQATGETTSEYAKKRLAPGLSPRMGATGPVFAVRAWQCAASQYANSTLALGAVVTLSLEVEPEPRLQGLSEVERWWIPVAVFTGTPDAANYFAEHGFPVRPATITFQVKDGPTAGAPSTFLLEVQDASTHLRLLGVVGMDQPAAASLTRHFTLNASEVRGGLDEARNPATTGRSEANLLSAEGRDAPLERPTTVRVVGHKWPASLDSFTWLPFDAFPEETGLEPEP